MSATAAQVEPLVYINGRFLTQPVTGVQRVALELTSALQRIRSGKMVILAPSGTQAADHMVHMVGRLRGHMWEQFDLCRYTRGGTLINLGNSAPLRLKRQIVVIHDAGIFRTPAAYSWRFRTWYSIAHRHLTRSGTRIATVSDFSRREIALCLQVDPGTVEVLGAGADHMNRIVADPRVLTNTGLTAGRFVLTVGSLAAHKNLQVLGQLSEALIERGMTLAVAGGLSKNVFQGAKHRELPRARYIGRVTDEELKALYETAACYVFPSRYEGFGLPALEAMACGCPVVASDIPALREVCGEAALYCRPDAPSDFANQVCRLLEEEQIKVRLLQAATKRTEYYSWDRAARALDLMIREYGQRQ